MNSSQAKWRADVIPRPSWRRPWATRIGQLAVFHPFRAASPSHPGGCLSPPRALAARFDVALAGDLVEMEIARGESVAAGPILLRALAEAPREPKRRFLLGVIEAEAGHPERARALAGAGGTVLRGFAVAAYWHRIIQGLVRTSRSILSANSKQDH
jgi:hypothetical protein